jgi:Reverse transcriptase (RNA-dependent DNA polymerase)
LQPAPAPETLDVDDPPGTGSPDASALSFAAAAACANELSSTDPRTWAEALASPHAKEWRVGYLDKLDSIRKHGVYKLVPHSSVPIGHRVIKCRPLFKLKCDEANNPVQFKVRLVAQGFTQIPGVDFTNTYSPVARLESQRIALHITAVLDWEIEQLDIKTAFLHGELKEEIWMEQPKGFEEPGSEEMVWLLLKGLYGLKQGGRTHPDCLRQSGCHRTD